MLISLGLPIIPADWRGAVGVLLLCGVITLIYIWLRKPITAELKPLPIEIFINGSGVATENGVSNATRSAEISSKFEHQSVLDVSFSAKSKNGGFNLSGKLTIPPNKTYSQRFIVAEIASGAAISGVNISKLLCPFIGGSELEILGPIELHWIFSLEGYEQLDVYLYVTECTESKQQDRLAVDNVEHRQFIISPQKPESWDDSGFHDTLFKVHKF